MSTKCCGKDWSIEPTYAEVVAFSKQHLFFCLFDGDASFSYVFHWQVVKRDVFYLDRSSWTNWWDTLCDLNTVYTYLYECPDCIQDWFKRLYGLTLLLEED
jgi:hypothetical protein